MGDNVQSVVRAFDVLRVLASHDEDVPLHVIAAEASLPKSTASRMLATLESIGMVQRGMFDGTYSSGPALAAIGGRSRTTPQFLGLAHPYLVELVDRYDEDAALAVADGHSVIYPDQVHSAQPIQVPNWTRQRFAPHTVAAGFVIMAWWPESETERYLAGPLERETALTMTDPDAIWRRLEGVRRRGFLWEVDEWVEGISAVAAAIADRYDQLIAVLSVFGPSYRFPGERDPDVIGHDLKETADRLARHFG
jgi:DNA-binding IclR family transcriptional regulator